MKSKYSKLFLTLIFSACTLYAAPTKPTNKPQDTTGVTVLKEASEGFTQVAENAIPAVVSIKSFFDSSEATDPFNNDFFFYFFGQQPPQMEPSAGFGSGFFISADGYILTNNHLVQNATKVQVITHDGSQYEAQIIGTDPNTDVALIKVDGKNFPFLVLADSDKVRIGQWAIAVGNPFELEASLTVGVVSATGRARFGNSNLGSYIQTDAAINPGNSGGPLLDLNSQVIGINTAILTKTGGYMGLSFAVPSNLAKHVSEQLKEYGHIQHGYLGVRVQVLTPDIAKALNLDSHQGVVILEVTANSPAQKAGFQEQDVILKINNKPLTQQTSLSSEIGMMKPGTSVTFTINRDGKIKEITAVLGQNPLDLNGPSTEVVQSTLGIEVQNLTPEYAKQLGYTETQGVIITKVKPNSQMAIASVRPGTLILAVNRQKVNNTEEFQQALSQNDKNKHILLLVKYGKITRYISVTLK